MSKQSLLNKFSQRLQSIYKQNIATKKQNIEQTQKLITIIPQKQGQKSLRNSQLKVQSANTNSLPSESMKQSQKYNYIDLLEENQLIQSNNQNTCLITYNSESDRVDKQQVLVKNTQVQLPISLQHNTQAKNEGNPEKTPYVYMINNLMKLYPKIQSKYIRLYIKQLSTKHRIPYKKLLIVFGIQQIIARFLQTHEVDRRFTPKYILSQLQQTVPLLLARLCITNWFVARKIMQGVINRFGISKHYDQSWLYKVIRTKKKVIKQNQANANRLLAMGKNNINMIEQEQNSQCAHDQQVNQPSYSTIRTYLKEEQPRLYQTIQLQQSNLQEIMQDSFKEGLSSKLIHYKKTKQKCQQTKKAERLAKSNKLVKMTKNIQQQPILQQEAMSVNSDLVQHNYLKQINFMIRPAFLTTPKQVTPLSEQQQQLPILPIVRTTSLRQKFNVKKKQLPPNQQAANKTFVRKSANIGNSLNLSARKSTSNQKYSNNQTLSLSKSNASSIRAQSQDDKSCKTKQSSLISSTHKEKESEYQYQIQDEIQQPKSGQKNNSKKSEKTKQINVKQEKSYRQIKFKQSKQQNRVSHYKETKVVQSEEKSKSLITKNRIQLQKQSIIMVDRNDKYKPKQKQIDYKTINKKINNLVQTICCDKKQFTKQELNVAITRMLFNERIPAHRHQDILNKWFEGFATKVLF